MSDKDRIRLALAIGYTPQPNEPNGEPVWLSPDGEDPCYLFELPNPFTDANDSHALRMWLIEEGWHIEERFEPRSEVSSGGYYLEIWHPVTEVHHRQDSDYWIWMEWFAKTALKVLDNE